MSKKVYIKKEDLSKHRETWAALAKKNGWYTEPFFVQLWVSSKGSVVDSISFRGIEKDIFVSDRTDKLIKEQSIILI